MQNREAHLQKLKSVSEETLEKNKISRELVQVGSSLSLLEAKFAKMLKSFETLQEGSFSPDKGINKKGKEEEEGSPAREEAK